MVKRIGVLTGGGDCPGLNAVIRAVVKTAVGEAGLEVIGFRMASAEWFLMNIKCLPLNRWWGS